jgi:hypothetical protein
LQTSEAVLKKARSPKDHCVARAAKLVGNLQVGWPILGGEPQDQPTTEDQRLRRGMGSREGLQAFLSF